MKTLKDLKLCKKTHEKVEAWLQEWLTLFEEQANHKEAWVYRCDFEKSDFFWFTNCKDILEKDPEAKGQENNMAIRSRKRKVMMQLFLKTLMGKKLGLITITCNHCGYKGCWINSLPDGNGHWVYCPKCKKTDVHVFPMGYDTCMNTIQQQIAKKQFKMNDYPVIGTPRVSLACQELIKEMGGYQYKYEADNYRVTTVTCVIDTQGDTPRLPSTTAAIEQVEKDRYVECPECRSKILKEDFGFAVYMCKRCYVQRMSP